LSIGLAIDCLGDADPTLIFVHGGFCDRHDWRAQAQQLSSRFRIITLDLPGHGDSEVPATANIETLARSLDEVIARYREGGVVLVGHSLGCRVVLQAFRRARAGVIGLVLTEGGLIASGDPDQAANAFKKQLDAVGFIEFTRPLFEGMFTPDSDVNLRRETIDRLARINLPFAQELLLDTVRWDASEAMRALTCVDVPILIVDSTYLDENFQRLSLVSGMRTPWMELVARLVPQAEFRIVPGVGHFLMMEAGEVVSDHIGTFASRVSLSGSATRRAC
jgi:pimeloyl-ACP methyl ester carboxylesterase